MSVPEQDKVIHRKDEYLDKLVVTVAARIAEELIFGPEKIGSGAAGDIQQVTNLARAMVTQMGYSDKLGRVRYPGNQEEVFLGHSVTQSKNISEETARIIDQEVIRLVQEAESRARNILNDNIKDLHVIAKGLLEYETLTGEEINNLIKGIKPKRDDDLNDSTDNPSDDSSQKSSNKGPLPSFTKDQNFPLPN
jgi:cell division protease FtsH